MTKWPEAMAVKRADAITVANFLYNEIICRHGCLRHVISDRGTHFRNNVIKELTEKIGTKYKFSTPYHRRPMALWSSLIKSCVNLY